MDAEISREGYDCNANLHSVLCREADSLSGMSLDLLPAGALPTKLHQLTINRLGGLGQQHPALCSVHRIHGDLQRCPAGSDHASSDHAALPPRRSRPSRSLDVFPFLPCRDIGPAYA